MTTNLASRSFYAAVVLVWTANTGLAAPSAADGYFTAAQSERGRSLYDEHCAACHGPKLEGGGAPALAGRRFTGSWSQAGRNIDDLFYIMTSAMPRPAVGSLTTEQNVEILAYILEKNGLKPGGRLLTSNPALLASITLGAPATEEEPPARRIFIAGEGGMEPRGNGPSAAELRDAATSSDWLYHNHNYRGTRYSPLAQLHTGNVDRLQVACIYQVGVLENFLAGPIVHDGTLYVTTARLTVAIDAASCRERWRHAWQAEDQEIWLNNRGVAIQDGYVVRGTADGYLVALDSADGRLLWARQVARPAAGETITMPPMIYDDLVLVGPAGSENNVQGWIGAFSLADGTEVWRFNTIPKAGEPGFETWGNDPEVPVGGGAIWTPLSLDVERGELYVPVTNPAPDFPAHLRPGRNLYTNSLLALDVNSGRLKWYSQLVPNDDKDWDLTQVSPIFEGVVQGRQRKLIAAAGKDGIVRVLDRDTHEELHQTVIGTRLNEDTPISIEGTRYCPGVLGGVQWNGPAWHPGTNMLYVPTVDWCWTATLDEELRLVPGTLYFGASLQADDESQGYLTAIDAATGSIRWQYRSEEPMLGAVTTTAGGLLLAGETVGDLLAFDAATGNELYRFNTGGTIAGGVVTYAVGGRQFVAVTSGKGSAYIGGRGAPIVVVLSLPSDDAPDAHRELH
jgi:alcohol dehydrogenase (cytochrome c)